MAGGWSNGRGAGHAISAPVIAEWGLKCTVIRIGVIRALNRHVERVFNPDRKDTQAVSRACLPNVAGVGADDLLAGTTASFASVTTSQEALSGVLTRRKLRVESDLGKRRGAHWIEQAARAITGRLIRQLPARRRFHRTLLISAGPSPCG